MTDALRGLYARHAALQAKVGDQIVRLSRVGSALVAAADDDADEYLKSLELSLRSVEAQIAAYERSGGA